jgi:hypothetical protein
LGGRKRFWFLLGENISVFCQIDNLLKIMNDGPILMHFWATSAELKKNKGGLNHHLAVCLYLSACLHLSLYRAVDLC